MGTREQTKAMIFDAFKRHGEDRYGEDVSQLQHALQCAQLARKHECTDALIIAALLHDIGRMLVPEGNEVELKGIDAGHEVIGANALASAYPPTVTEPIRLHVAAKRYLCATDAEHARRLSAASQLSLAVQGGPMSEEEVLAFESQPFFADAVMLRRFDDWGKGLGCGVSDLYSYAALLDSLVVARDSGSD